MDQSDRDVVAARLMRFRDENGDRWADLIDMLSLHRVPPRSACRAHPVGGHRGRLHHDERDPAVPGPRRLPEPHPPLGIDEAQAWALHAEGRSDEIDEYGLPKVQAEAMAPHARSDLLRVAIEVWLDVELLDATKATSDDEAAK